MWPNLPLPKAQHIIWQLLDRDIGRRPTMREVARAIGTTALKLRRGLKHHHASSFREILTYCCTTYAARLIGHGIKIDAAMTLAGFQNRTNFNRQFREFIGCLPHEFVGRAWTPLREWPEDGPPATPERGRREARP